MNNAALKVAADIAIATIQHMADVAHVPFETALEAIMSTAAGKKRFLALLAIATEAV